MRLNKKNCIKYGKENDGFDAHGLGKRNSTVASHDWKVTDHDHSVRTFYHYYYYFIIIIMFEQCIQKVTFHLSEGSFVRNV